MKNLSRFNNAVCFFVFILSVFSPLSKDTYIRAATTEYSGEPKTIAHDFLDMEKGFGAGKEHYLLVDRLINKAVALISPKKSYTTEEAVRTLKTIDLLLSNEGYVFKNNFLLCRGLERKVIDCDNYCALYTAIAEVLNIPIIPVYAPNHSFIRFFFDDGSYMNWETTQGQPRPDSYYIQTLAISGQSIKKGVYMKSLSRKEFLGVEYNNIGAYLMTVKKFSDAIPVFNSAIALYPLFASAYHNRGTSFYAIKRHKEALDNLLKANELDDARAGTHNTLGDIYFDMKDYGKALDHYSASIKLDPANYVPYNSVGLIMKLQGRMDQSQIWLKKSQEIKSKYAK